MTFLERIRRGEFVLIAEIGVNYHDIASAHSMDPMDAAKLMIREARTAGAHAVKFQSYRASTLVTRSATSYWDTMEEHETSQYDLFAKYDSFGSPEYRELAAYCASEQIEFMSTAFDFEAVDYLDGLMTAYKVSSSDITNLPFIAYQAGKGKPIILSTGASTEDEIRAAVGTVAEHGAELVLMHCVLEYPTPYEHASLQKIATLRADFPSLIIGYSDHCRPDPHYDVIKSAYLLGATVVEKHFTLDKTLPGNDHYHAMDPSDVRGIISSIEFIDTLGGSGNLDDVASQEPARKNARRSIVATRAIPSGTRIVDEMVAFKRPGLGVPPSRVGEIVGRRTVRDIGWDELIALDDVESIEP